MTGEKTEQLARLFRAARRYDRERREKHLGDWQDPTPDYEAAVGELVAAARAIPREGDDPDRDLAKEIIGDLVTGIERWASEEDGVPEWLWHPYANAKMYLNWEFHSSVDLDVLGHVNAHQMDASDGPVCRCGAPSTHESGACADHSQRLPAPEVLDALAQLRQDPRVPDVVLWTLRNRAFYGVETSEVLKAIKQAKQTVEKAHSDPNMGHEEFRFCSACRMATNHWIRSGEASCCACGSFS